MKPGDVAIIFTPDDSHFNLAAACIKAGLHVLVAKPIVKTLHEHKELLELARKQNVLVRMAVVPVDAHISTLEGLVFEREEWYNVKTRCIQTRNLWSWRASRTCW
jgi:hypothetical protein